VRSTSRYRLAARARCCLPRHIACCRAARRAGPRRPRPLALLASPRSWRPCVPTLHSTVSAATQSALSSARSARATQSIERCTSTRVEPTSRFQKSPREKAPFDRRRNGPIGVTLSCFMTMLRRLRAVDWQSTRRMRRCSAAPSARRTAALRPGYGSRPPSAPAAATSRAAARASPTFPSRPRRHAIPAPRLERAARDRGRHDDPPTGARAPHRSQNPSASRAVGLANWREHTGRSWCRANRVIGGAPSVAHRANCGGSSQALAFLAHEVADVWVFKRFYPIPSPVGQPDGPHAPALADARRFAWASLARGSAGVPRALILDSSPYAPICRLLASDRLLRYACAQSDPAMSETFERRR